MERRSFPLEQVSLEHRGPSCRYCSDAHILKRAVGHHPPSLDMPEGLFGAFAHLRQQRVFAGLFTDGEISAIRLRKTSALQAFTHTTYVIIDCREIAVGGRLVQKQR